MKKEYLDIVFKAVSLKDVELLVFVLSKDINKDMFKSLSKIMYKDNKNIYEYLLVNKELLNLVTGDISIHLEIIMKL